MKNKTTWAILGAGIAGLGAAYRAREQKLDYTVYESTSSPGGLLKSFTIQGFRFDQAVHFSFTEIPKVREIFDQTPTIRHAPNAYCSDRGYWLKHPVQNNLYPLPTEEKVRLLKGLYERSQTPPENYSQWLAYQYGAQIAQAYPEKYTQKYWGLEAKYLSTSWIGERMRQSSIEEILRGALERRDDNHYYTQEMRYPQTGGYFEFIRRLSEETRVENNKRAVRIDLAQKTVYFSDKTSIVYSHLISSLPLPILINMIDDVPEEIKAAASELLWTTVDLVSVGFNRQDIPPYLWYYLYDDDCFAARAYSPSMKSKDNAPDGKSSLQFEIYNLSKKPKLDKDTLIQNIKSNIMSKNICREEDILFIQHKHIPFANVVFDLEMEERRKKIIDYLNQKNLSVCGRFGSWDYLWSDQSFMSGYESL